MDWRHPLAGASRRLARQLPFRPTRLNLSHPVVSFTFDDFPASAAAHAAPALEARGMRGTFYFADALAGRRENDQPIASIDTVTHLAQRGHDIGGHTSNHLNVQRTPINSLISDVSANTSAITALSGRVPTSFAYPFGVVSLRAKWHLAAHYPALRGIQPGINRGWIDLAHLRAQELYDASFTPAALERLLDDLEDRPGWLIFYTHDVKRSPTSIGCSPDHFEQVLDAVLARAIAVETVNAVVSTIRGSSK